MLVRLLLSLAVLSTALTTAADAQSQIPNTQPLTWDGDLADRMMDGLHRFVEKKIDNAVKTRGQFWRRDTSSPEAYEKSIAPNRERLKKLIGMVDQRAPLRMEMVRQLPGEAVIAKGETTLTGNKQMSYDVMRVRWTVLEGVTGEGLLLKPTTPPIGAVVAIPDADELPEQIAGIVEGTPNQLQFARHLAEYGFLVLVPTLIDRSDRFSGNELVAFTNQPHREWIWRQSYHMGRHIIGFEVQKIIAATEWLRSQLKQDQKVSVVGYGEGGLLAFFSAAVDQRIDACLTSGYFSHHKKPWEEPLYRHVWALHREFGDAEIGTLIMPRLLVVDHGEFPRVDGPPPVQPGRRGGAALGKLVRPKNDSGIGEMSRISTLLPEKLVNVHGTASVVTGISELAIYELLEHIGVDYELQEARQSKVTVLETQKYDAIERQRRQVVELERFVQRLVRESDHTREKFFPVTALAQQEKQLVSSLTGPKDPRANEESPFYSKTAKMREYFRDEVLGKFDDPLLPPNARSRKIYDNDKWTGYDVVLDVFEDVFAWGVLLLPKDLKPGEKRPVVVCQHGRNGVPKVVIENDEKAYHDYAAKLAERGFIVFAPHNPYRGEDKYRFLSRKANCVKASLFSFILAQHQQILNWLAALPEVDPNRIAFYGLSYGGETAVRIPPLLMPVYEQAGKGTYIPGSPVRKDLKPIVPGYCLSICSADFNDWARKIASTDAKYSFMFTVEWEMPYFNMGSTFNYAEMVALNAPRPFMVERGHWDGVAPDEWVAYEYAKVRRMYDTLGIGDRTEIEVFDGLHEINGKGTFDFLHKHLNWPQK